MYERTYHAKVLTQHAPVEKKRRKRFPWKRFFWWCGAFVFLVGIIFLIRLRGLQVASVSVVGTNVVDPEEISAVVWQRLEGTYLSILPRTSMFLVPTRRVESVVAQAFPRLSSVRIDRKGVRGLEVKVSEYEGEYLWCVTNDECYFMTKEGIVFAPAPFFSGDAYKKIFVRTQSPLPFEPITKPMMETLLLLLERLPLLGIEPIEFKEESEHQLEVVFLHQGRPATLILDHTRNTEAVLEDLATGLGTEPLKARFRDAGQVLEYLDARFANKIVYKFK
jgi:hypothetical protein